MQRLSGIGVSGGAGAGRAVVLIQRAQVLRFSIAASQIGAEIARLEQARQRSAAQLDRIQLRLPGRDLRTLFEAQRLMVDDPMLLPRAASIVGEQRINAEWALQQVFDHLGSVFDGVEDPYLRERKGDLADVVGRLRMNLTPGGAGFRDVLGVCEAPCVLVADELPPSIAAQLDWTKFEAFITDAGSRTYHTAILARSLHVPAVVGLHDATARIAPGTMILVDGDEGAVSIDPPLEVVQKVTAASDAAPAHGSAISRSHGSVAQDRRRRRYPRRGQRRPARRCGVCHRAGGRGDRVVPIGTAARGTSRG